MMTSEGIDIVILNCNNDGYIQKCIDSIHHHTDGRYNLIVVDQNSQDGSREWLIDQKPVPHLILNKRNLGTAIGRNQGITAGRCPWIVLMDSDVEIQDRMWLDKMWNYTIDRRIGFIESRVLTPTGQHFGGMAFCMIRRQCFQEVGQFDRHMYIEDEWDWFARLEWSRWKTGYCYDTDISHHGGKTKTQGCLANKFGKLDRQTEQILRKKYTGEFLLETLVENKAKRLDKEKDLIR